MSIGLSHGLGVPKQRAVRMLGERADVLSSRAKLEGFLPRDHKQRGKEKAPPPQLESAALAARHVKVGSRSALEQRLCGQLGRHRVTRSEIRLVFRVLCYCSRF